MHRSFPCFVALCASLALSGCVARTVVNVATLPVRAGGKAVDALTTSQSEADEKRGRDLRRREARLGQLERSYDNHNRECLRGNDPACERARGEYAEIQELMQTVPAQPR